MLWGCNAASASALRKVALSFRIINVTSVSLFSLDGQRGRCDPRLPTPLPPFLAAGTNPLPAPLELVLYTDNRGCRLGCFADCCCPCGCLKAAITRGSNGACSICGCEGQLH